MTVAPVLVVIDRPRSHAQVQLTIASALAVIDSPAVVMIAGPLDDAEKWAHTGGFDRRVHSVVVVEHPALAAGDPEVLARAAFAVTQECEPAVVMLPESPICRAAAAHLGIAWNAPVATGALEIIGTHDALHVTRRVYEGAAIERLRLRGAHAVATFDVGHRISGSSDAHTPDVRTSDATLGACEPRTRTAESGRGEVDLETARIVIGVGGGVGTREMEAIRALSERIGAAVAGSKVGVSVGHVGSSAKVGLSGRTVVPDVYLALGISGASQHMAGCTHAGTIVAVNADRRAPIFRYARYGVVGDVAEIVPALLARAAQSD